MHTASTFTPARIARSLMALAIAAAFPLHAMAQETPAAVTAAAVPAAPAPAAANKGQPNGELESIIVTAQRRAENIRDVPMAITTLGGDKLDTLNGSGMDIRFLAGRTPSLNVESDYGRSFPRFYIRGLGNTDFDLNASQPVGLVYDDVVLESPMLKGFPVFDVNQVEVLRGPQGTLFGRNSPAGVIKFESTRPSKKLEGYSTLGFGNDGAVNFEGAINIPMGEEWAMRISGLSQSRQDRVHNPRAGYTKDFEGYEDKAGRVLISYKPNADFSALLNVHGRDMQGSATLFRANIIKKGTNEIVDGFDYGSYPTDGGNEQTLSNGGGSLRLRYDFEGVTIHSITGYEKAKFYSRGDVDGGYGATFFSTMGPGFIPFPAETADGMPRHSQLTQEFRVESNNKGQWNWIAGAYYFDEKIVIDSINFDSLTAGNPRDGFAQQQQKSRSGAAFGSVNYAVSDKLKLRAGVRYTIDRKDFVAQRFITPFGGANVGPLKANPSSSNTSWDLSGTYELSPTTNLYARAATGYRAPSIQGRVLFGDTISVAESEKALSVEAGI
ncbi:MAG TPA: TonB-dependent receptor, partial [Burkholderiaceae bacterium]